ncbi:hypothetical protein [Burkholderia ubonensis]|uniref:hypothetical protein n=1 Tax=Burkholderia ubonensis TaxID=101571 RepID=UPI0012FCA2E1|nr:hypothetical protein [Burkholderia ubonensis]
MDRVLWKAKLDSDFNERYWRLVAEKYEKRDFWIKLLLAIAASGTVAGWGLWVEHPALWKTLSACAAVASIASPLLAYAKKVEVAASHAGKWADLRIRYDELWEKWLSRGGIEIINREHAKLQKAAIELTQNEPKLKISEDKSLARRAQRDVLQSNGLNKEQ